MSEMGFVANYRQRLASRGINRITAKRWDDLSPFSKTIDLVACTNDVFRTVAICLPKNGSSSANP